MTDRPPIQPRHHANIRTSATMWNPNDLMEQPILETAFFKGRASGLLIQPHGQSKITLIKEVVRIIKHGTGQWRQQVGELAAGLLYMRMFQSSLEPHNRPFKWRTNTDAIDWCINNQDLNSSIPQLLESVSSHNYKIKDRLIHQSHYNYYIDEPTLYFRLNSDGTIDSLGEHIREHSTPTPDLTD